MMDHNGQVHYPTTTKTYNVLGQTTTKKDENELTTTYAYNAYGDPISITYPDGASERMTYYPNGRLKQKWEADGTSILYDYNPRGILIKKTHVDQHGRFLKDEEYHYKGPLLQSKKDAAGLTTHYFYDGAGRRIEEKFNEKPIRYAYDDFDRVIESKKKTNEKSSNTTDSIALSLKVSKTTKEISMHKKAIPMMHSAIKFKRTRWQSDQIAKETAHYHSDGTLAWQQNPLEHRTTWHYNHKHTNGLGQQVQCRTKIDPLGRPTREADDVLSRTRAERPLSRRNTAFLHPLRL